MLEINVKLLFLNYKRIWFAQSLPEKKPFTLISLRQYTGTAPVKWHEKKFITLLSDLTLPYEHIFTNIAKNTKYEIKRAKRENIIASNGTAENFLIFFNNFAPSKGLKKLSKKNMNSYKPFMHITEASLNKQVLVMHAYLVDEQISRVRLLFSATVNRESTGIDLNLIGRANRFLHWQDIILFKDRGIKTYDWGGIAGTEDAGTKGIDAFKLAFGGTQVYENHYESPLLGKIKKILEKHKD